LRPVLPGAAPYGSFLPGGMMLDRTTVIFLGVIATGLWAFMAPAFADGAVAIGLPSDVAKDGVSLGLSSNYPEVEAKRRAMANCHQIGSKTPRAFARS
jgi:hypothetical protein